MQKGVDIDDEEQIFVNKVSGKWKNKERTLFIKSPNLSVRESTFLKDIIRFTPHAKTDIRLDKDPLREQLVEICENKKCTNVVTMERSGSLTSVYLGKFPDGPTFKFSVDGIVSSSDHRFSGNALRYSRPLLSFSAEFTHILEMKMLRHLLIDSFGAPLNHPKTQPFTDRVLSFSMEHNSIHIRHYQISTSGRGEHELIEIGPRATWHLFSIREGFFQGEYLYRLSSSLLLNKTKEKKKFQILKKKIEKSRSIKRKMDHIKSLEINDEESSMDNFGEF